MTTIDLLPALRERNGETLRKSGVRLAADLQAVRAEIEKLIEIVARKFPKDTREDTEAAQAMLRGVLSDIDGIDPHDPPSEEVLEFLSHRAKLAANVIKLLAQQQVAASLDEELVAQNILHPK